MIDLGFENLIGIHAYEVFNFYVFIKTKSKTAIYPTKREKQTLVLIECQCRTKAYFVNILHFLKKNNTNSFSVYVFCLVLFLL